MGCIITSKRRNAMITWLVSGSCVSGIWEDLVIREVVGLVDRVVTTLPEEVLVVQIWWILEAGGWMITCHHEIRGETRGCTETTHSAALTHQVYTSVGWHTKYGEVCVILTDFKFLILLLKHQEGQIRSLRIMVDTALLLWTDRDLLALVLRHVTDIPGTADLPLHPI